MLNNIVKQQINTARDILVGKIPDPKGQIDQITNALIYKFMDDQDRLALTLPGGKANFFVGELKPYAWHKFFDSKLSNQDKANLYVEGIAKLSINKKLPDLFRDIFKDAFLPFRASDTISMFLGEINKFDYQHSEDLGNAFEYLLSIMGSQGDAGQFRTPRNIIEFIVDAVDPNKDESILDPACGTAGFLIEAYKHITKNKKLTPNEVQELAKHIHGVDIDPGMAKIARVNLYLHGFKTPLITEDDTLSNEKLWGTKYDIIFANPPFMTPKGGIIPHDKFSVLSNRAEVLFTDYIAEHLKLAGRAGIVVPEGIIFQSGNVYKKLRKMLIDDSYLWGVISLPAGVFNPYSGVKTSILLLDRKRAAKNKEILFFKVDNDGFDLGAQRREISKNDLPEALEVVKKWKNGEKTESSKAIYVEKSKISENDDYNLSVDQYRVTVDYGNTKWPMVELREVVEILDSKRKPITKSDRKTGQFPYYGATGVLDYVHDYIFDDRLVLIGEDGAKWGIGDKTAFIAEGKYWVNNHAHVVRPIKEKLIDTFLVSYLNSIDLSPFITGVTVPKLNQEKLKSIKVPLPPLEIQEQIVAELDGYANIIAGAKQIIQNWKPKIDINLEWEKVKLGEVCDFIRGPFGGSLKKEIFVNSGYAVYEQSHAIYSDFSKFRYFVNEEKFKEMERFEVRPNDLIMSCSGTMGKTAIVPTGSKRGIINQALLKLTTHNNLNINFLKLWMDSSDFQAQLLSQVSGVAIQNVASVKVLRDLYIILPAIETQKQIVEKIEAERTLVESSKKLIEIYEQKTKESIAKLWEE